MSRWDDRENPMPLEKPEYFGGPTSEREIIRGEEPLWVQERPSEKNGDEIALPVKTLGPDDPGVDITFSAEPELKHKARHLLDMLDDGMTLWASARKLHSTVPELQKDTTVRERLKELIRTKRLPPEVRKEMVRSGLNSLFMKNIDSVKIKEQKLALDVAKQISKDPEIGLSGPQGGPTVNIDIGSLAGLIEKMKPIPGLEEIDVSEKDKE